MKKIPQFIIVMVIAGSALLSGACAKPPTEEMENAVAAVTRAENDADAAAYAGNALIQARDALSRMRLEADTKQYGAAKNYAAEAISSAEKAVAGGKAGAARAKSEAEALVSGLNILLKETGEALNAAGQIKNIQLDFDLLFRDLESAGIDVREAGNSLAANNYKDAVEKGERARSALSHINSKISEAATLTSRKK
jgi:hypothetical protein